jgi:hypothetical protein
MIKKRVREQAETEVIVEKQPSVTAKFLNIETKSFKEQAIDILNILNSKGINIYDENNTPGMYLKRKSSIDNSLKQKFVQNNNSINNNEKETENKENLSNLFQFFKTKNSK